MSRYQLTPIDPIHECFVGWDPGLNTYFAQVLVKQDADDLRDLAPVFWVGGFYGEVPNAETIISAISRYAAVNEKTARAIREDKDREGARPKQPLLIDKPGDEKCYQS